MENKNIIDNKRISGYDSLKGLAIILVCIGHILQTNILNFSDTHIHAFIFAVQMPLFMVISGYFGYSKKEYTFKKIGLKAIAYLVPFLSHILIYQNIFQMKETSVIERFLIIIPNNIDAGLWYLWVIFFLYVHLSIVNMLMARIKNKNSIIRFFLESIVFFASLIIWVVLAITVSPAFLGCKLILYYSIFYYSGYIYHKYIENKLNTMETAKNIIFAIFSIIGVYVICHFEVFTSDDSIKTILIRLISGFTLSFSIVFMVIKRQDFFEKYHFNWIGKYSLEIYYVHGIAFSLMQISSQTLYTVDGMLTFLISILITAVYTAVIIGAIKCNSITDFLFFGKLKSRS